MARIQRDIHFHEFADRDYARLIRLTEAVYPHHEITNPLYLRWEYEQNPDGKAVIHVAEDHSLLVSQYLVLPRTFCINGKKSRGSLSVNTLTHPDFRGLGLFQKLAEQTYEECLQRGIGFTAGFPNPVSHPVFISKLQFKNPGRLPFLLKPLRPLSTIMSFIRNRNGKAGEEIQLPAPVAEELPGGRRVSSFHPVEDGLKYDRFLENFNARNYYATLRSAAYLNWRYREIPLRNYQFLKVEVEGEIEAIAVLRSRTMYGLRAGIVLEFIAKDTREGILSGKLLMKFISRYFVRQKMQLLISAMQQHAGEYGILKSEGYYRVPERFLPQQLEFIIRLHGKEDASLLDFSNWFLTLGDNDIF